MRKTFKETLELLQFGAIRRFLIGMVLTGAAVVPLVVYALLE